MTPKYILFVCSGNTCRSPMAKVILERKLAAAGLAGRVVVDSAAYNGPGGEAAHPWARLVIKQTYGEDLLADHVPKKLTGALAEQADLILVMEEWMRAGLPADKVVVLDIPDPFSSSLREYGATAGALMRSIDALKQKIDEIMFGK